MNLLIVLLIFIIFLIPLWLLFGRGEVQDHIPAGEKKDELTAGPDEIDAETDLPERSESGKRDEHERGYEPELTKISDDFVLPHDNKTIIDQDSPFSIYRRTLDNTQYYLEKGDFDTATDLYNGLLQRISDKEIRRKIEENIDYLNNYQQIAANRQREKKIKNASVDDNEIRVTLGGQEFVPENIKIDITPPSVQPKLDMDELIESITGHVSQISPAIEDSNKKLHDLKEYRDELERVKEEIQSFYDLKEESQRVREQRIDEDLARINELKDQIERENEERTKNLEIDELKREIDALRSERTEQVYSQNEIAAMRGQMESLKQELARSSQTPQEIKQLQDTIQNLRDDLAIKEKSGQDIQLLTRQITSLSDQLQTSQTSLADAHELKEHVQSLQDKLSSGQEHSSEIVHLKNQVDLLTRHIAGGTQKNDEIASIQNEIKDLGEKLQQRETTQQEMRELHTQINELKGELQEKEKKASEISELKSQIQILQSELSQQRTKSDEIRELKEKISQLETERLDSIKKQSDAENNLLREQIDTLKTELAEAKGKSERKEDLSRLKEAIADLEKKSFNRQLNTQQLEKLRDDVKNLAKDAALSTEMEQKIDRLLKEGLAQLPAANNTQIETLTNQIETLKNDLVKVQNQTVQQPPSSQTAQSETAYPGTSTEEVHPSGSPAEQVPAEKESAKEHEKTEAAKPDVSSLQKPAAKTGNEEGSYDSGTDSNLSITPKKEEDNEEEFETLQDHLKGPQFDEPSEDEILEKILADSGKKEDKEYEIRGTDENEDISEDFDISKLFAPAQINHQDEEFYSQFMDKHRPRVKKELPILQVSFRFDKLPELSSLSKESNIIESTFYKYKHLLEKANEHIKRRQVNDALNYYETVLAQDIPEEFKNMIRQNIRDLNEYLEKYMLNM